MNTLISKKVIGFDSWSGSANYASFAKVLHEQGWDFYVVHIGSWSRAVDCSVENIAGVEFRDISAYEAKCLDDVLAVDKPDAVVFLSVDTFAHRAFNRLAQRRGIPTLHIYHGLVSVQDANSSSLYKINFFAQLRFVLERLPKALRHTWPAYASALIMTRATVTDWLRFSADIVEMALGRQKPTAAADAHTTLCCVYTHADLDHAMARYGFLESEVQAVGNPDLSRFGLRDEDIGSRLGVVGDASIIYVDTGLLKTGYCYSSVSHFVEHLVETRNSLESQGFRVSFKLHPKLDDPSLFKSISSEGLEICSSKEFVPSLRTCSGVLVEPTTLALVPALMGLPLILNRYGALSGQKYGPALLNYPRHGILSDIEQFSSLINAIESHSDLVSARAWIEQNAGPLPSENMPNRIAEQISRLVFRRPASNSLLH